MSKFIIALTIGTCIVFPPLGIALVLGLFAFVDKGLALFMGVVAAMAIALILFLEIPILLIFAIPLLLWSIFCFVIKKW